MQSSSKPEYIQLCMYSLKPVASTRCQSLKRSRVWKRSTSLPQEVQPAVKLRAKSCATQQSAS